MAQMDGPGSPSPLQSTPTAAVTCKQQHRGNLVALLVKTDSRYAMLDTVEDRAADPGIVQSEHICVCVIPH